MSTTKEEEENQGDALTINVSEDIQVEPIFGGEN